jgi:hypothetical protein
MTLYQKDIGFYLFSLPAYVIAWLAARCTCPTTAS